MKHLLASASLLLVAFSASRATAETFTASIYEQGSQKSRLLFNVERKDTPGANGSDGKVRIVTRSAGGAQPAQDAVIEEAIVRGAQVVSYRLEQKQTGDHGSLEIKDGKVFFSFTTSDGKTKTAEEDAKPNLIVGPTTIAYLQQNWKTILAGDDVDTRYASLDRRETVGFKFFKLGETDKTIQVKMKPTSIIIAALVDPLIFTFSKDAVPRLLELHGRAIPKHQVDGKWKDLDADIVYKY
jgi:hypothetical protein